MSVPNGELRVVDDVASAFADVVSHEIDLAVADRTRPGDDPFTLVLSGGSTARECYQQLAREPGIDWGRVECLVGDERCVPADDKDANQAMIRSALVGRVEPSPQSRPMSCECPPEDYQAVVAACPDLDLVHLGLGPDGHTASLFPGSAASQAPLGRLVERNVDPSGRNKHERLTLTFAGIAREACRVHGLGRRQARGHVQGAAPRGPPRDALRRRACPLALRPGGDRLRSPCRRVSP